MVLPVYLAMTEQETEAVPALPRYWGRMASLSELSDPLPAGAMLVLTDRIPCRGHDPRQIAAAIAALGCESVLLDFVAPPDHDSTMVADALFQALPCPVAVPPGYAEDPACPVFLPPCPLHIPLAEYLHPWQGRNIWLDVTLQQRAITVTPQGTQYGSPAPADRQAGGWFDEILLCRCMTEITDDQVRFTLFDTPETLKMKLEQAAALDVTRAVGLYQELYGKL